jgi:A/G-specific adenine glycosylase
MLGVSAPRNPNRRSAHHVRQSKFAGSDREIRGKILRLALAKGRISRVDLERTIPRSKARIARAADALVREGFLRERNNSLFS